MNSDNQAEITRLLSSWQNGEKQALDEISEYVSHELHRLAAMQMSKEGGEHTLQATALVNEAFIELIHVKVNYHDRIHFFNLASRIMRRILVDYAKTKKCAKRGSGAKKVTLYEHQQPSYFSDDMIELDEALSSLALFDQRKADILHLQFFAGLKTQEIADLFHISKKTVERNAHLAKAWLSKALSLH